MTEPINQESQLEEPGMTFAGTLPNPAPAVQGTLSLEDPEAPPEKLSIIDAESQTPALTGEEKERKATKIQFALGDKAPDRGTLLTALGAGDEASLRRAYAAEKDARDKADAYNIVRSSISEGVPQDPGKLQAIENLIKFQPKNNPDTVFEKAYADTYMSLVGQIGGPFSIINKVYETDPDHVMNMSEIAHGMIVKQEIGKGIHEFAESLYKEQGWGSYLLDKAKDLATFNMYSWYKQYNAIDGAKTSGTLKGSNIADQVGWLWTLPPDQMHQLGMDAIRKLAADNPSEALSLAEAIVSFGATDAFLSNVGNVADLVTFPFVGTIGKNVIKFGATAVTKGGAAAAAEASANAKQAVTAAYQTAVRANARVKVGVADVLADMGETSASSVANVAKRLPEVLTGVEDTVLTAEEAGKRLPSLFNPEAWAQGSSFSATATARLVEKLRATSEAASAKLAALKGANRLPQEAEQVVIKEAQDAIIRNYGHPNHNVVDMVWEIVPGSKAEDGLTRVATTIGQDAAGNGFDGQLAAWRYAKAVMKLPDDEINIAQQGGKFFIRIEQVGDETSAGVREAIRTTSANQTPVGAIRSQLMRLFGSDFKFGAFQNENRIAATSAASGVHEALKPMMEPILALSKKEMGRLQRVMEEDRAWVNPANDLAGKFHQNIGELNDTYMRLFGRPVSEREARAYAYARKLNDMEYHMRNTNAYAGLARQGYFNIGILDKAGEGANVWYPKSTLPGKVIDNLPFESAHTAPAQVVIHRSGQDPQRFTLANLATAEGQQQVKQLQEQGYKVIQTANPERAVLEKFGPEPVNFIVTKDFEQTALNPIQIEYREGWHQIYRQQYFTKQAVIHRIEDTAKNETGEIGTTVARHHYSGDTTIMGHTTEAEALKWSKAFEEARQIAYENKAGDLGKFLEENLPMYNEQNFRNLFEGDKAPLLQNVPIQHTYTGRYTTDTPNHGLDKLFTNFQDNIRSPWNAMEHIDKKFMGQRDSLLNTVKEGVGTEGKPIFSLMDAPLVDPISSLSIAMNNIMRSKAMADYKISAVESWIAQFGHLLQTSSEQDLWANAVYHLHNPRWLEGRNPSLNSELISAQQSRKAIIQFLGSQTQDQSSIYALKHNMASMVYKTMGQDMSEWLAPKIISGEADPAKAMRGFAFHTTFFMDPFQGIQNAMTMVNAMAIGGLKSGYAGFTGGHLFQFLRMNSSEGVLARLESIAQSHGWKEGTFTEAWEELKKTGRMAIEGEHAWRDDLANPQFFKGALGNILDKGQVFFKAGERQARMTAWATAFHEWREANPTAEITSYVRNQILKRADDMNVNMTRASAASWQQGLFSIPTQFLAWNARIAEQFFKPSSQLSIAEKFKLMAANSAMYGVGIGVSMPVGALYNPYEDIKSYMLDKGWNVDNKVFEALHRGVVDMGISLATGRPTTTGERMGPGGNQILRDLMEGNKDYWKLVAGVSGSKVFDALTSTAPLRRSLWYMVAGKKDEFPLSIEDFNDVLRNVTVFDKGMKAWQVYNTNQYITKNGVYEGDMTGHAENAAAFLLGGKPRAFDVTKQMIEITKNREEKIKEATKEVIKNRTQMLDALINYDEDKAREFEKRAGTLVRMMDLSPDEEAAMAAQIENATQSREMQVPYEFAYKYAYPSVAAGRQVNQDKTQNNYLLGR